MILLGPEPLNPDTLDQTIAASLTGAWGSNEPATFWPGLTGALNYAIRARLPGLSYFARIMAFGIPEGPLRIGTAIVWLIEPTTSGRTVLRSLNSVLNNSRERDAFFQTAKWFLTQIQSAPTPQPLLRNLSGCAFSADAQVENVSVPLQLCEDILRRNSLL